MTNKKIILALPIAINLLYSPVIFSEENYNGGEESYEYVEDVAMAAEPIYQDPTGIQVRFNDDGTMKSIVSSGESELRFGDRKDIRQALKKATMRAKSHIAKFMNESLSSDDVMNEITNIASKDNTSGSSEATREVIESQVENIKNSANAILSGIVTLSQDINREEKYVTVTVGVKDKTINAASSISNKIGTGIQKGQEYKNNPKSNSRPNQNNSSSNSGGREIRRSKMYDDF